MEIVYPSSFSQRIFMQESPGDEPVLVSMVIPSVIAVDKPFDLKLAIVDKHGLPSLRCSQTLTIFTTSFSFDVSFVENRPAVGLVRNLVIHEKGFHRLEIKFNGMTFYSNPAWVTDEAIPNIYWGDPHIHTVLSNCHPDRCRSLNFCYTAGRHVSLLDWITAADHVSGNRCSSDKWKEQRIASDLYNDPPAFVTLPGYEVSLRGGSGGDNNVYLNRYSEMFCDLVGQGTTKDLCEKVASTSPEIDFFVIPHHTTRIRKHGEISDAIYPGPNLMPVVEIHSKWGTSEYRGNPNPLKEIHPGPSYVVDFLNRGLMFGFVGGTDTHATLTFARGIEPEHIDRFPGLTAVRTDELTREKIFQGIKSRSCYAASQERIYLDVKIAGQEMGQSISWDRLDGPRSINVSLATQSEIASVAIIRNGQVIHEERPRDWNATFHYTDFEEIAPIVLDSPHLKQFVYYYVRVTCVSGAQAWSSPVWLLIKDLPQELRTDSVEVQK